MWGEKDWELVRTWLTRNQATQLHSPETEREREGTRFIFCVYFLRFFCCVWNNNAKFGNGTTNRYWQTQHGSVTDHERFFFLILSKSEVPRRKHLRRFLFFIFFNITPFFFFSSFLIKKYFFFSILLKCIFPLFMANTWMEYIKIYLIFIPKPNIF